MFAFSFVPFVVVVVFCVWDDDGSDLFFFVFCHQGVSFVEEEHFLFFERSTRVRPAVTTIPFASRA